MDNALELVPWQLDHSSRFVIALLERQLRIVFVTDLPMIQFSVYDTVYSPLETSDFNGFYDWFSYQHNESVAAVQFCPLIDDEFAFDKIKHLS